LDQFFEERVSLTESSLDNLLQALHSRPLARVDGYNVRHCDFSFDELFKNARIASEALKGPTSTLIHLYTSDPNPDNSLVNYIELALQEFIL